MSGVTTDGTLAISTVTAASVAPVNDMAHTNQPSPTETNLPDITSSYSAALGLASANQTVESTNGDGPGDPDSIHTGSESHSGNADAKPEAPPTAAASKQKTTASPDRHEAQFQPEQLHIPQKAFTNLAHEIFKENHDADIKVEKRAIEALQKAAEAMLSELFQKSGELATHDKRKTILARDFAWAREFTRGAGA